MRLLRRRTDAGVPVCLTGANYTFSCPATIKVSAVIVGLEAVLTGTASAGEGRGMGWGHLNAMYSLSCWG